MGESGSVEQETISPIEYLDKLCDYALSIGMPYDLYWYGDPRALLRYIKADELKLRRKNYELWLQGLYVYQAIGSLVPVLNMGSKDHKAKKYMQEPIPITQQELEERRLKRIKQWTDMMMSKVKKED